MNKQILAEYVSKHLRCSKSFSEKCVTAVCNGIKEGVRKQKAVHLTGFGSFVYKNRKARNGFNPQTRRPMKIGAARTVVFKPGKEFRESL